MDDRTPEELQARLDEIAPDVQEAAALEDTIEFYELLEYLVAEGFMQLENGRLYPQGDSCSLNVPPLNA